MTKQTTTSTAEVLLAPFTLSEKLTLRNRVLMAPMTRCKADDDLVATEAMAAYYGRRGRAGLIISEGAIIRPDGLGYPNVPGIYNQAQVDGWRPVTERVHDGDGKIFLQLWHVGRVSHPVYLDGEMPIAPSAIALTGRVKRTDLQYGTPRALGLDEIPPLVEAYADGASNALAAGFDGVEIHGATGYLIAQFLHHHTNRRTDAYGGSPERMARFALEVVDAVVTRIGNDRVGIRLSPGAYHYMDPDPNDPAVFRYLLTQLESRKLAYIHLGIFDDAMTFDDLDGRASAFLRRHYTGTLVGCGSYTPERAARAISQGEFDLIALGRSFIANADLIEKIERNEPLVPYVDSMLARLD